VPGGLHAGLCHAFLVLSGRSGERDLIALLFAMGITCFFIPLTGIVLHYVSLFVLCFVCLLHINCELIKN